MASSISLLSDQGSTFCGEEICTILLNIYSANGTPVGVENNPIIGSGEYRPASEHLATGGRLIIRLCRFGTEIIKH